MREHISPIRQDVLENGLGRAYKKDSWVSSLLYTVRHNDPDDVYGHLIRTGYLAAELAMHLGFSDQKVLTVLKAGLTHDVGKMVLRPGLLIKDPLLSEDREEIKKHIRAGVDIVGEYDPFIAKLIGTHHDQYPKPIPDDATQEDIELIQMQTLIALADKVDALLSGRCYKGPWTPEETRTILAPYFKIEQLEFAIYTRLNIEVPQGSGFAESDLL